MSQERVHIYSGEWKAYWRPDGHGYTPKVEEAGVWGREAAERIARGCGPEKQIILLPASVHNTVEKAQVKVAGEALAAAWRVWLASVDGQASRTIPTGSHADIFQENRLWWAFMAGAKAAEEIATAAQATEAA